MSNRAVDWKENLSNELRTKKIERRELFLALMLEEYSWREALDTMIKTIGVKEYAEMVGMAPSNLINQLKPEHNLTLKTLERIMKPLDVEMTFIGRKR